MHENTTHPTPGSVDPLADTATAREIYATTTHEVSQ
jgi:hypothetical protein